MDVERYHVLLISDLFTVGDHQGLDKAVTRALEHHPKSFVLQVCISISDLYDDLVRCGMGCEAVDNVLVKLLDPVGRLDLELLQDASEKDEKGNFCQSFSNSLPLLSD